MSWFFLALLAPVLYAVVNLLDDNLLSFVYESPYLSAASAGFYGSLPLLSRFFIHASNIPIGLAILSVLAGFLTLSYYFLYFKGLQLESPSVVVAIFSLAPATIPLFAHFIVHEQLNAIEIAGFIVVLIASLGLVADNLEGVKISKAFAPILIAVVLVDIISIMTKYVYQRVDFYPAYLYFSVGMAIGGITFFLMKFKQNKKQVAKIRNSIKKLLPIFIIAELFGLAAELTLNLAISRGPVSLVKVIEGVQPLIVLLFAITLYPFAPKLFREAKEGSILKKIALMVLMIFGIAVISIAAKV